MSTTPDSFAEWAQTASPGENLVYFTGHLASAKEMAQLAGAAYALQEAGLINLLQKRVRPNVYAYIAQRRCPPHASCEDQDEFSKSAPSPCPSPEPAAATRGRVNAPVAPEAKALHALEVRLNRDLLEAREKLAKTVAGSSAHMKLERFIDQCGRALRFVHNELA